MFSKIRYSIGNKLLARRARKVKRNRQVHNFQTCREAAIVFDATIAENFNVVKEFMKFLSDLKIDTELIGYIDGNEIHSNLLLRDNCHFFTKKDLNLFYIPKIPFTREFITRKFDILFDLTLKDSFPLRYLTTLSISDFKAGRYIDGDNPLDLMIDIRKEPKISYLIEQIKNYVSRLNNPDADI